MNTKLFFAIALIAILTLLHPAYGHDPKFHREHPIEGTVTSISKDGFEMLTEKGTLRVKFQGKTSIELGKEGHKAAVEDLKASAHVTVIGTKLESGELVAKEVMIEPAEADGGGRSHSDEDHHDGHDHP